MACLLNILGVGREALANDIRRWSAGDFRTMTWGEEKGRLFNPIVSKSHGRWLPTNKCTFHGPMTVDSCRNRRPDLHLGLHLGLP